MRPLRPLSVLVIDREPDALRAAAQGYRAAGATGGREALALAAADPPDVDLSMPGVDGFEVARRVRELARPPALAAVSGMRTNWDRQRAAAAGFAVSLVKPVPPDELVDLLRQFEKARSEQA